MTRWSPALFLSLLLFLTASMEARKRSLPPKPRGVKASAPQRKVSPRAAEAAAVAEHQWAQRTLRSLSLQDMAAQLVVAPFYGENPRPRSAAYKKFAHLVKDLRVGGLIIINLSPSGTIRPAEPHTMAAFLNRMQKLAKVPLLVGGDFERGASMRVTNTTKYPHNMAFAAAGDVALSRYEGAATAREARALGVQWLFVPDADVNNNPDNPVINIRSYGEDPATVAAHVQAYIEGARSDPRNKVLVTVKHFPGHGDVNVDSHLGMPSLTASRERMNAVELVPFRAAIAAHVDAVMTAHMAVPAVESEDLPSTVSPKVLTGLLRNELRFPGLIVTDAMDMQGLSQRFPSGEASVRAIEAGADVLLMPGSPDEAVQAVVRAVRDGRITQQRLEASVMKVLLAKAQVGLPKQRQVDVKAIDAVLDSPEAKDRAQQVADRALTLVRDEQGSVPLQQPANACFFLLSENRRGQQGLRMQQEITQRSPASKTYLLDATMTASDLEPAADAAKSCGQVVIAAFAGVATYRNGTTLSGNFYPFVEALTKGSVPVTLVSLGNPYLIRNFPNVPAYLTSYTTVPAAESSVVRGLFGEMPIQGHLPVSIPGFAKLGDGLERPENPARASAAP